MTELAEDYRAAEKREIACPVCESRESERFLERDRYGLPVSVELCRVCGTGYINPAPVAKWLDEFYEKHYWELYPSAASDDESRSANRSDQILRSVLEGFPLSPSRCLDVGCGNGGMIRAFQKHFPSASIAATDASASAVAHCLRNEGVKVVRTTWRDGNESAIDLRPELVTMVHVLEHVPDPGEMLLRLRQAMAEDSYIYVEVPDLASPRWGGISFFHIAHITYFTDRSLEQLLRKAGFQPVFTVRGACDEWPWGVGILGRKVTPAVEGRGRQGILAARRHRRRVLAQLRENQQVQSLARQAVVRVARLLPQPVRARVNATLDRLRGRRT